MATGGSQYERNGKTHYERNKDAYMARVRERRDRNRAYVNGIKARNGCKDCGISDHRVLDFDHMPGFEKRHHVSFMVVGGFSLSSIDAEIAKCELVCANCHRIRTHERLINE